MSRRVVLRRGGEGTHKLGRGRRRGCPDASPSPATARRHRHPHRPSGCRAKGLRPGGPARPRPARQFRVPRAGPAGAGGRRLRRRVPDKTQSGRQGHVPTGLAHRAPDRVGGPLAQAMPGTGRRTGGGASRVVLPGDGRRAAGLAQAPTPGSPGAPRAAQALLPKHAGRRPWLAAGQGSCRGRRPGRLRGAVEREAHCGGPCPLHARTPAPRPIRSSHAHHGLGRRCPGGRPHVAFPGPRETREKQSHVHRYRRRRFYWQQPGQGP